MGLGLGLELTIPISRSRISRCCSKYVFSAAPAAGALVDVEAGTALLVVLDDMVEGIVCVYVGSGCCLFCVLLQQGDATEDGGRECASFGVING
jgi:hypothetical protein